MKGPRRGECDTCGHYGWLTGEGTLANHPTMRVGRDGAVYASTLPYEEVCEGSLELPAERMAAA